MTAFLTIERSLDPLTKSWGFTVTTDAGAVPGDGDAAWGFSRSDAIGRIWPRLVARGYTTYFVTSD